MANARRIEKIENLLREVIAAIVLREIQFAEGTMVTVTRVAVSEDLYYARVFVSVFGGSAEAEAAAIAELERSIGLVQHELNRRLRMRPVPKIRFAVDDHEKRRKRIEELLGGEQPATESD